MRVISKKPLREFWERHPDAQASLQAWYEDAVRAEWETPAEIKAVYRNASIVGNNRAVFNIRFNIKGNDYRLIVQIHYNRQIVYIRFVGTHREYDEVDAATV